jgi:integrase
LGRAWNDWGLVFPSSFGKPVGDDMVRKVFARICVAAEVPVIRIHDLRHTCATLMLLAGVNVKVVSERLGHASVVITMQTYAHVLPGMQEDAAITLERVLRGTPRTSPARPTAIGEVGADQPR